MLIQYVAPPADGGSDSNDGSSWDSPKATWKAAYVAIESGGVIYIKDGCFWQTDTTKGCLIVGAADPLYATVGASAPDATTLEDAGWVKSKAVTTVGIAATKAQTSRTSQAFIFGGGSYVSAANPNPNIWLCDAGSLEFRNILVRGDQPFIAGTRALDALTNDQACNVTQTTFSECAFQCNENFNAGPAMRIANAFWLNFKGLTVSACGICPLDADTATNPVGKPVVTWSGYAYRPWHFIIKIITGGNLGGGGSPTFKWSTDGGISYSTTTLSCGASVMLTSAAGGNVGRDGSGVSGPPGHEVYAAFANGVYVANDLYTIDVEFVDKASAVLLDGFAPAGFFEDVVINNGNMRLNTSSSAQSGLNVSSLWMEGPIGTIGAPAVEILGSSSIVSVYAYDIRTADVRNGYDLWVSPDIKPSCVIGSAIQFQKGGIHLGGEYVNTQQYKTKTLLSLGGFGISQGVSEFRADHGRRMFTSVASSKKNQAPYDPALWATSHGGYGNTATIAGANTTAPDGTSMARTISSTSGVQSVNFYTATATLTVGDGLIFGVWVKGGLPASIPGGGGPQVPDPTAVGGINVAGFSLVQAGTSFFDPPGLTAALPWSGDGEWQWVSYIGIVTRIVNGGGTSVSSIAVDIKGQLRADQTRMDFTFYAPVFLHLLGTDYTQNEMHELHLGLAPFGNKVKAGGCGFLPGQDLYVPRRLLTQNAPTFAAPTMGTGAGTTPGAVTITGDEIQCKVSFTTGAAPVAGGVIMTVTFPNGGFADAAGARTPMVTVEPGNAAASLVNVFATETSTTFVLTAPTGIALAASTAYVWKCRIVG